MNDKSRGEIIIYTKPEGSTEIQVTLKNETVWLTESEMACLFDRDRTVIGRHIRKIFRENELDEKSNVQKTHIPNSDKPVSFFTLDVILSVGYRVNSKRGTQFRIWANRVLKEHLIKGFTINEQRLREKTEEIELLKSSLQMVERTMMNRVDTLEQAKSLVSFLADFSGGLGILDDYDHENLDAAGRTRKPAERITAEECLAIVDYMKKQFASELFGRPQGNGFASSVNQIYQSFSEQDIYPSVEEKAAMLLYLVVKNHSFVDGNKRIAASVFLYFLDRNNLLYSANGKPKLSNEGLATVTLLIAESRPEEMETIKRVVISILNRKMT